MRRSASTGQRPTGAKSQSESALAKPQSVPTVQKTTSALSLFAKYKNKSKSGKAIPATTPTPHSTTPRITPGAGSPAPMPTPQSAPASIYSASTASAGATGSGESSLDKPSREEKKRLSVMANDFFGTLLAEAEPAGAAMSQAGSDEPAPVVAQRASSGAARPPPPSGPSAVSNVPEAAEPVEAEPASESEDDLSDDDSSDDDSDSDADEEANAGSGKGSAKASDKFWDKMKEADDSGGGDDASAEAKRIARREKLAKMANTNY